MSQKHRYIIAVVDREKGKQAVATIPSVEYLDTALEAMVLELAKAEPAKKDVNLIIAEMLKAN